jgi:hypothetical protein
MYKNGEVFQNEDKSIIKNYKYQIEEYIGSGANGMVYKVRRVFETQTNLDVEVNLNK